MKTLFVIRHAKSSWDEPSLRDFDRPLNNRGKRDGPAMATMLAKKYRQLDLIVTSTARRARNTAKFFRDQYSLTPIHFFAKDELYHAGPHQILAVVQGIDNKADFAAVFGHNPGMTDFVNCFGPNRLDNLPTCGIAIIETTVAHWSELTFENGRWTAFYYPKMSGLL